MKNGLFSAVVSAVGAWVMLCYKRAAVEVLRIEGAQYYVQGVDVVRRAAFGTVCVVFATVVAAAGALLLPVGVALLVYRWWGVAAAAAWLCGVGGLCIVAIAVLLGRLSSERFWMRLSRADRLVAHVLRKGAP